MMYKLFIILSAGFLFLTSLTSAEENKPFVAPYIYYPGEMLSGTFNKSIGLTMASLPVEYVEEAAKIRSPFFDLNLLYALPSGFALDGRITSQLVTNQFVVGGKYYFGLGPLDLSVGFDVAYWFGFLHQFGYDSEVKGWNNYPNATAGINLGKVKLSFKAELLWMTYFQSLNDGIEISTETNLYNGFSYTFAVEQPLWGDNYMLIGLKGSHAKYHYQAWQAFPTFDRMTFVPEIIIGFID
jgi:hypothetical protein